MFALEDKKQLIEYIVIGIQVLVSIFFMITLFALNVLPAGYMVGMIFVLLLMAAALALWIKKSKGKKTKLIPKITSIVLSILIVIGGIYIIKGSSFLNVITGADTQTNAMAVIVMEDSKYEELSDLKGKKYGIGSEPDKNVDITMKEIKRQQGALYVERAADMQALADALYAGTVDAVVVNEAYKSMLEVNHKKFDSETRVIWRYRITEGIKDEADHVDVTSDPFNIYISGIDTIGPVSTVSRSDVNMILTVNPVTREILMTGIPRDYYVTLPSYGQKDKLTHSGIYGINESIATIESFMGIDINYYARVNFTSVKEIVNALGGIKVYSDRDLELEINYEKVYIKKGVSKMDGRTALRFARERYSYVEGDAHRVQNQQAVVKGIIRKVTSPSVIKSYSKILKATGECMETSMKAKDLQGLAKMQLSQGGKWHMIGNQVSGIEDMSSECYSMPETELCVIVPDGASIAKAAEYINKVIVGEKIDIE
ncbi:MAG: LCP family protein [Clostridiales bacterium]|nr:LCP family protein [Clostridiales bacterium]